MNYQYKCECGHIQDEMRSVRDPVLDVICKKCGKVMERDFAGELQHKKITIPEGFKAVPKRG